jgi:HEAT repeat protein
MKNKQPVRLGAAFVILAVLAVAAAAGEPPQPAPEALADFQKAWKPLAEAEYMRPLDDAGWKARVQALRALARAGDSAVAVLTDALNKGDDETRVFAAQALALLPDPAAKASLVEALKDKQPAVRLYALNALGMFGKPPEEEPYLTLRQKDPNRDVRAHAAVALEPGDRPQPAAIRQALRDYDLKKLATAKVGDKAPDFTLTGAAGEQVRLGDFRGQKPVVLFVYGDT